MKNMPIIRKISLIILISGALSVILSSVQFHLFRDVVYEERESKIEDMVKLTISLIAEYDRQVKAGVLTLEEAQASAGKAVQSLRWGNGNYFTIFDYDGKVVVHPDPERVGKNLGGYTDKDGHSVVAGFIDSARKGGGFSDYVALRPPPRQDDRSMPKRSYSAGYDPWRWTVQTGTYIDDVETSLWTHGMGIAVSLAVLLTIGIGLSIHIARSIVLPLNRVTDSMARMAGGELGVSIAEDGRKDEIGRLAAAAEVFRAAMKQAQDLTQVQILHQSQREEAGKAQSLLIDAFNTKLIETIGAVIGAANRLEHSAQTMSAVSVKTAGQSVVVAGASEQAAGNVRQVAEASEELSASGQEIAAKVAEAKEIAHDALTQTEAADQLIRGLSETTGKIGAIVSLINDIASQTNLLALNATIEAARAGTAGKGFAVVAGEVKNLAGQTARATDEISSQIAAVQRQTAVAVEAVGGIASTTRLIDDVSGAIALAVERQTAATRDISHNIQEAHAATSDVAANAAGVSDGANQAGIVAKDLLGASSEMSRQAEAMRAVADDFLIRLQSGGVTLEWGEAWLTGNEVIDADHRMLVQYVNELNHAMHAGEGRAVVAGVLDRLVAYTIGHFEREEVIWRKGGLSNLAEHQRIHADLTGKVQAFQRDLAAGKATLTADLMSFLREWLVNHVFRSDKAGVKEIAARAK